MAFREREPRESGYHRRSNGESGGYGGGHLSSWGSSDRRRGGGGSASGEPHRSDLHRKSDWGPSRGRYSDYSNSRSFPRGGGGKSSRDIERGGRPFSYPKRSFHSDRRGQGYKRSENRLNSYRSNDRGEKSTMTIAATDVGKIIGRGGSTVKDLEHKSGAKIKITNNTNHIDSKVDLFGSVQQRDKAEELINDLLNQSRTIATTQPRTFEDDNRSN